MDHRLFVVINLQTSIPGHALHEKGLQRQKGVVPLSGSQEKKRASRPADRPLKTGGQPLVLFLRRFTVFFDALEGTVNFCFLGK